MSNVKQLIPYKDKKSRTDTEQVTLPTHLNKCRHADIRTVRLQSIEIAKQD